MSGRTSVGSIHGHLPHDWRAFRLKEHSLGERKQTTILAIAPDTLRRFIQIRGEAASFGDQDGIAVIGKPAQDSLDVKPYP